PGLAWLLGLLVIPLVLGVIGWSGMDRSKTEANATLPSVDPSASLTQPSAPAMSATAPAVSFAPLSIMRNGNSFTLTGDLPSADAKTGLLDALRGAFGPGITLTDNLNIKADANAPDFAGLGSVFGAAAGIPDFHFDLNGDTLTLTGTAPSEEVKSAVEE